MADIKKIVSSAIGEEYVSVVACGIERYQSDFQDGELPEYEIVRLAAKGRDFFEKYKETIFRTDHLRYPIGARREILSLFLADKDISKFIPTPHQTVSTIINKRLVKIPKKLKEPFPSILKQEQLSWATISEKDFLMVIFISADDKERISKNIKDNLNPFVGLITTEKVGAAFRVENSRYMYVNNCSVNNSYAISLGPDSTIILENHKQSILLENIGNVSYTIPLAYIISYGNEIDHASIFEYLDGLVAYSTNQWRGTNE